MKKNISINISGIIFHIEEDGYSKLKGYLESINSYFSSYEDSSEIIADIESRIAEIFLSKLDDGKQIINIDDVGSLIATMGTTADFEAIEDEEHVVEDVRSESKEEPNEETQDTNAEEPKPAKRLLRDEKKRILGGVASGMAYYFGIDPLWVRLIMVLMFLNVFFGLVSGAVFIAYIVLWIVIPGSYELGEDKGVKKMYRDPDTRVLGGVASGIAAYFGVDKTVIRLVFVLSIFLGGSGLILYLVLWIITPEANTITEKMQMQGEPVTLSNIEHNVKESLSVKEGEENLFAKVLLFPFRVIAAIFQALGKVLGPASKFIVEALRVIAGLVITVMGLSMMVGLVIAILVLLGFMSGLGHLLTVDHFPIQLLKDSFPTFGYISIFIAAFIPLFSITLLGISILIKRFVFNAPIGWGIFGLWVLSIIGIAFSVPKVVGDFRSEGEYKVTRTFDFNSTDATLNLRESGMEDYDMVNLKLRGHSDSLYTLDMRFKSRGNSRKSSIENAQMVTYNVLTEGSNLNFDSNLSFTENAVFRAQELVMILYIPYNQVFMMNEDLRYILTNTINHHGYKTWQMADNKWMFTEDDLICVTCEKGTPQLKSQNMDNDDKAFEDGMVFEMEDFEEIEVRGNIKVIVSREDIYYVEVKGSEKYLDKVYVKKLDNVLSVELDVDKLGYLKSSRDKPIRVYISLPELNSVKGWGASDFDIADFKSQEFYLSLSGASSANINIDSDDVEIKLKGASSASFSGKTKNIDADIAGASGLDTYDLEARFASIDASGASSAKIYAKEKLNIEASGMSSVRYKGSPEVSIINESGLSSVTKSE
jgi:phage shock protein PspC (stress-responsive transcriptional regulator)